MTNCNDSFSPHKHPSIIPILEMRNLRHRQDKECPKATQLLSSKAVLELSQSGSRVHVLSHLVKPSMLSLQWHCLCAVQHGGH